MDRETKNQIKLKNARIKMFIGFLIECEKKFVVQDWNDGTTVTVDNTDFLFHNNGYFEIDRK